jgi:hypothetical protein
MSDETEEPRAFCSECGGSTPHTTTLWGLKCDLCGTPRPVHGVENRDKSEPGASPQPGGSESHGIG